MSSERFNQLAAKHAQLRSRAAMQRHQLGATMSDIEQHLTGLDRGIGAVHRLIKNPVVVIGGVAILALIGPKRLMGWVSRGALIYSTARRFIRMRRHA